MKGSRQTMTTHSAPENDAFRALSMRAQWLFYAVNDAGLRRCGVADLWPRRYAMTAAGLTEEQIVEAARELHEAGIAVYDETVDEIFFPGYIAANTALNNLRMVVAVTNSIRDVASLDLRGVISWELNRIREANPDSPAWADSRVDAVLKRDQITPEDFAPSAVESGL